MVLTSLLASRSSVLPLLEAAMIFVSLLAALAVVSGITLCAGSESLCAADSPSGPKEEARRGAVSSLDARCSAIGAGILRRGGNAADAVPAPRPLAMIRNAHLLFFPRWSRRSSVVVSSVRVPVPPPFGLQLGLTYSTTDRHVPHRVRGWRFHARARCRWAL
jgi:hypothetical protein